MRVSFAFKPSERLDGRSPQIPGPVAGRHDRAVNSSDDIDAGVAALDLENDILSYLFGRHKLHLIGCRNRLEFAPRKKAVFSSVHADHLELAQFLKPVFGDR